MPAFDPSGVGQTNRIFGLPQDEHNATVVILPVPWDVTTSYRDGTRFGPQTVLDASGQLDLSIPGMEAPWQSGIFMGEIPVEMLQRSTELRALVKPYLHSLEDPSIPFGGDVTELLQQVDEACLKIYETIRSKAIEYLDQGKIVGILGGEHSCALPLIAAMSTFDEEFGVLQIDAHMDLRMAYEGFKYSHASIFYNAISQGLIPQLTQVGIRDYAPDERAFALAKSGFVKVWYDQQMSEALFNGTTWDELCDRIIEPLPARVYISLDIDGLDPALCPGTGTPVPGGMSFNHLVHLLKKLLASGRVIIGFDLCEVAPGSDPAWNGNVGARVLYHLSAFAAASRNSKMDLNKIVIAPNALKGSLSSWEAASIMGDAIKALLPEVELVLQPIADGGDDTLDVLVRHFKGTVIDYQVLDPLMRPIQAPVGFINDGETAIIELAAASGIRLLPTDELNPMLTTTHGTGELIMEAVKYGAKTIWITLGGSATVDGGLGMMQALGYRFYDESGDELPPGGQSLQLIHRMDDTNAFDLSAVEIKALVDVDNPTLGQNGAARIFGPQKGANPQMVEELEIGLSNLVNLWNKRYQVDLSDLKHGGAAGGIAATIHAVCNGKLVAGASYVLEILGMAEHLSDADLLITAEGKLDRQSLHGKGPYQVAKLAQELGVKVVALGGKVPESDEITKSVPFDVILPITNGPCSLEEAVHHVRRNLQRTVNELIKALLL